MNHCYIKIPDYSSSHVRSSTKMFSLQPTARDSTYAYMKNWKLKNRTYMQTPRQFHSFPV